MDFRPFGDGMSCVAVAMPRAALQEGTTGTTPELRRIYAAGEGAIGSGRSPMQLPIRVSGVGVCEAELEARIRRGCAAQRRWARIESACVYVEERRDEAYQSRPAAGRGSRCGV
jgi:hypothetical protein